jgi:hypothetical protein
MVCSRVPALAAPFAYDQPTITRSWSAFLVHVPTMLLIWVVSAVITAVGLGVNLVILAIAGWPEAGDEAFTLASLLSNLGQLPFSILASFVGVLFVAVPALYFSSGSEIGVAEAFSELSRRPLRYFLAGVLFAVVSTFGVLLCILPGLLVALVMPVYVNLIFTTDRPINDAFAAAFQACYGTPGGRIFLGIELLVWAVVVVVAICTCGLGALLAVPLSSFYLQNAIYHRGLVS